MRPPRGGGFRGRDGGRGGRFGGRFGGRGGGGGRGRGGGGYDDGPPAEVVEISSFLHACEGDAVTKITNDDKIPYFNAPIYLQNKTKIGNVDEIFGPINEACFSMKMMEGIIASSYTLGDKFFIDPAKLLPLSRFVKPTGQEARGGGRGGRGGFRGRGARGGGGGFRGRGGRGGGGGFRGRGGPPRGGGRGGFRGRGRS